MTNKPPSVQGGATVLKVGAKDFVDLTFCIPGGHEQNVEQL